MQNFKMFQVDAFTDELFKGNPAAVLYLEDWLADEVLQSIAMENNLAETAFVKKNGAGFDLRWFTPTCEVNFCGHATLATAHILFSEYGAKSPLQFTTRKVGTLSVAKNPAGGYVLDIPCFEPEDLSPVPKVMQELLGTSVVAAFRNFENHYAVLSKADDVRNHQPDLMKIAELYPDGLVITAAETEEGSADFVSRYFAPGSGIPEDPVTGSAHSTLVPYWADKLGSKDLLAYQASSRGGWLNCSLKGDRVHLSGNAITFMEAQIRLPA